MSKGDLKVIEGHFDAGGDPYVMENFVEALDKMKALNGGKIKAFAIVTVNGDDSVGTVFSEGDRFHALLGGISSLEERLHREISR